MKFCTTRSRWLGWRRVMQYVPSVCVSLTLSFHGAEQAGTNAWWHGDQATLLSPETQL